MKLDDISQKYKVDTKDADSSLKKVQVSWGKLGDVTKSTIEGVKKAAQAFAVLSAATAAATYAVVELMKRQEALAATSKTWENYGSRGKQALSDITKYAEETRLPIEETIAAAQKLLGVWKDPGDITRITKMAADAAADFGKAGASAVPHIESLLGAFTEIGKKSKFDLSSFEKFNGLIPEAKLEEIKKHAADLSKVSLDKFNRQMKNGTASSQALLQSIIDIQTTGSASLLSSKSTEAALSDMKNTFFATMDSITASMFGTSEEAGSFMNKIAAVFKTIRAEVAKPEVQASLRALGDLIKKISEDSVKKLVDGISSLIVWFGSLTTNTGPLNDMLDKVNRTMDAAVAVVGALSIGLIGLGAAWLIGLGPIGWAVAGLVAITGTIAYFTDNVLETLSFALIGLGAAWLLGFGPIGWVIGAIAAVGAAIGWFMDDIKKWGGEELTKGVKIQTMQEYNSANPKFGGAGSSMGFDAMSRIPEQTVSYADNKDYQNMYNKTNMDEMRKQTDILDQIRFNNDRSSKESSSDEHINKVINMYTKSETNKTETKNNVRGKVFENLNLKIEGDTSMDKKQEITRMVEDAISDAFIRAGITAS